MYDYELYKLAKETGLTASYLSTYQENLRKGIEDRENY
jgi:hypothetical protein